MSGTPTVIMDTAYDSEELHGAARSAGHDAFLVKPISQSTPNDTVMNVSGRRDLIELIESRFDA